MRILLQRITTTKGRYMGDEGVGYAFVDPDADPASLPKGDFSAAANGRLQGRDDIVTAELDDRYEISVTDLPGEYAAWLRKDYSAGPFYPAEMIANRMLVPGR